MKHCSFAWLAVPVIACALPAWAEDSKITVQKAVAYLPEGRAEKADIYLPVDDGTLHPAVLIVHGGGWSGGKRDAGREINIGTTLASHGYVCMSIDYLLADPNKKYECWPQNLHDCKTAVRWLRENASKLHVDTAHIGAIGGSAGGHLVSMLGVTQAGDGLDPKEPYASQSCAVQCVVNMYGPADLENWKDIGALGKSRQEAPELYRQFSVLPHLDKGDPPFLILHGTADKTVPLEQATILDAALEKTGIEHHLEIVEGAPHSFHLEPKQKDLRPLVLAFFDKHLRVRK
jgi:acetyl esterase/lipase